MKTTADIFEELGVAAPRSGEKAVPAATSAQHEPLLEYIDYVSTPIDRIVKRGGLTATTISSMLIRIGTARVGSMWRWRVSPRSRITPTQTSRTHGDVITVHRALYAE